MSAFGCSQLGLVYLEGEMLASCSKPVNPRDADTCATIHRNTLRIHAVILAEMDFCAPDFPDLILKSEHGIGNRRLL